MLLHVLPTRTASAAENMATDFLLLQRYPDPESLRFRHYDWRAPAFTFGYGQKIAFVRAQLPAGETVDLCRRPTGGGIVDHRADWTYTLVIPRGHRLEESRATESYRRVHEALAAALRAQNVPAVVKSAAAEPEDEASTGICFQRAEVFDVMHRDTAVKIAGAAQKRTKHGLLFQGSLWRPAVGAVEVDWDRFQDAFAAFLGEGLECATQPAPWPDFADDELENLTEQYSSPQWLEHR